jgi:hypothetical protein
MDNKTQEWTNENVIANICYILRVTCIRIRGYFS